MPSRNLQWELVLNLAYSLWPTHRCFNNLSIGGSGTGDHAIECHAIRVEERSTFPCLNLTSR
jgi:hypothetical protein